MNLLPPTVIRDFRSDLDQTRDEPYRRPEEFFAQKVELPEHGQQIEGQYSHEVPGDKLVEQNRNRKDAVPSKVIQRLLRIWEVPDIREAHRVEWFVT